VQRILEKIEASATARLVLPPGRSPAAELARYRAYLKVQNQRLKILHRSGLSGRRVCEARAVVIDRLLGHLLEALGGCQPAEMPMPPLAIVAVGGYGRRELNPHSDIDVMFLHDGEVAPGGRHREAMTRLTEAMLVLLFDLGFKVGHSVRTVEDCVHVANQDMQSKTSLIEARWVAGQADLFERMERAVLARCVRKHEAEYVAARLKDQAARRAKYGDSATMQEPNVKNGCGGLRDLQNLLWMAFFKHRVRTLSDLEARGWINPGERRQLENAYDFLLRIRTELHYQTNRAVDVLMKSLQPPIALSLGFADRSPMKRVERFMRPVYTHMRRIYLLTRTLEQRLALEMEGKPASPWRRLFPGRRPAPPRDGFQWAGGEIRAVSSDVFREEPARLMRVFLQLQQRGLRLHPDMAQLIRHELPRVDRGFRKDAHVRDTFLEILSQRGRVAPVLRAMHEVDLLGRYLPEFGKLTCLVQHEFFHRYTADEHTLVAIEMLDQVWTATRPPFEHFREIFRKIEHPHLLYLALLLHDAGKATASRRHAADSAKLALRVARRLELEADAAAALVRLVEHHLAMIQMSQRHDLDDPGVARKLAREAATLENLNLLLLLTFADSLGTSAAHWNDFKETLLWTLYQRTADVLAGVETARTDARRREELAGEVRRLAAGSVPEEEIAAHFAGLPPRYFRIRSAAEIAADAGLAHRFFVLLQTHGRHALEPQVAWQDEPDRGYAVLKVCTWDRAGLFSRIAGSLTAAGLNILSAQIFSRSDGVILDLFYVCDARTGALPRAAARARVEEVLRGALLGDVDVGALVSRAKREAPLLPYLEGERLPPRVRFDATTPDVRTAIEVQSEDRVGLLYSLVRTLSDLGLDISTAKICTENGAAIDTFYVSDAKGGKVADPARWAQIERGLIEAIRSLDGANPSSA